MNKLIVCALVSSMAFFSCSTTKSGVIHKDINSTDELSVSLKTTDTLRITMEGNVTTGFNWYYNELTENASIKIVKDTYEQLGKPKPAGWVGAPSTKVYEIVAAQEGKYTLTFEYKRSWEAGPPARVKTINLDVIKP